jgi:integrase
MSKTRYLQKLGQSWYLRVKVPATLQRTLRNTHIRRALHTRDLDEANRRKWTALAQVRAYLDAMLAAELPASRLPALELFQVSPPRLPTPGGAPRCYDGLDELVAQWCETSQLKTVRFQRRQAYAELRQYLGRNCTGEEVSPEVAATYVDTCLLRSRDSPSTRRRKLSALRAFWSWMASRRHLPVAPNPWSGFRIASGTNTSNGPIKRPYTDIELVTLFSGSPTYPTLREVMALGLFSGARIDEICSLRQGDVRTEDGVALVRIAQSKTRAGLRTIAIRHPIPLAILAARHRAGAEPASQLFHELKGGGYDEKLSWHVGQAFRYHRNRRGLSGETDFHSLRRTFITRLENLGVDQVSIARYVGHSLPTLAFKLYSGGATEETQRATGQAIRYAAKVEEAVAHFLEAPSPVADKMREE